MTLDFSEILFFLRAAQFEGKEPNFTLFIQAVNLEF